MSKKTATATKTKTATKTRAKLSPAMEKAIASEFAKGSSPAATAKATKLSVHVVAPRLWALEAKQLGSIANTPAAILAARKAGQRREVVAFRASVPVSRVREIETSGKRKPIYVGKGTKKHLAVA